MIKVYQLKKICKVSTFISPILFDKGTSVLAPGTVGAFNHFQPPFSFYTPQNQQKAKHFQGLSGEHPGGGPGGRPPHLTPLPHLSTSLKFNLTSKVLTKTQFLIFYLHYNQSLLSYCSFISFFFNYSCYFTRCISSFVDYYIKQNISLYQF